MDAERWKKIDTLVQAALERRPEDRAAFVAQACHDDTIRAEVESLIAAAGRSDGFLEAPAIAHLEPGTEDTVLDPSLGMRTSVGPYRIEDILGRGGMGAVYLAARADHEYERQVAIKLLHPGLETAAPGPGQRVARATFPGRTPDPRHPRPPKHREAV
jgi:serine/threonine-protein kinase